MGKLLPYSRELEYGYAPGAFPSYALLEARPECVRRLLLHSKAERTEGLLRLLARCEQLGVRVEEADRVLANISRKENCFAAAVFSKYTCALHDACPHVVLHQPSDMGNMGAIFRTCLGFGFLDIAIIEPAADMFDPRAVRASMGALFSLRVQSFDRFETYRAAYPNHTLFPFMLGGDVSLREAVAQSKGQARYSLVFGNEAAGLPEVFSGLGQAVRIPHSEQIDSLNLAIAVAIGAHAFRADALYG